MFSVRIKGVAYRERSSAARQAGEGGCPATKPGARDVARTADRRTDVAGNARRRWRVGPRRRGCGEAARPRTAAAGGHFGRRSSRAPVVVSAWSVSSSLTGCAGAPPSGCIGTARMVRERSQIRPGTGGFSRSGGGRRGVNGRSDYQTRRPAAPLRTVTDGSGVSNLNVAGLALTRWCVTSRPSWRGFWVLPPGRWLTTTPAPTMRRNCPAHESTFRLDNWSTLSLSASMSARTRVADSVTARRTSCFWRR